MTTKSPPNRLDAIHILEKISQVRENIDILRELVLGSHHRTVGIRQRPTPPKRDVTPYSDTLLSDVRYSNVPLDNTRCHSVVHVTAYMISDPRQRRFTFHRQCLLHKHPNTTFCPPVHNNNNNNMIYRPATSGISRDDVTEC